MSIIKIYSCFYCLIECIVMLVKLMKMSILNEMKRKLTDMHSIQSNENYNNCVQCMISFKIGREDLKMILFTFKVEISMAFFDQYKIMLMSVDVKLIKIFAIFNFIWWFCFYFCLSIKMCSNDNHLFVFNLVCCLELNHRCYIISAKSSWSNTVPNHMWHQVKLFLEFQWACEAFLICYIISVYDFWTIHFVFVFFLQVNDTDENET